MPSPKKKSNTKSPQRKRKYHPINTSVKKRWVKALQSGKYKQCLYYHRYGDKESCKYDVIGVLLDIYQEKRKNVYWEYKFDGWTLNNHKGDPRVLPKEVIKWAGLKFRGYIPDNTNNLNNPLCELTLMNDTGDDFKKIAKWIGEKL